MGKTLERLTKRTVDAAQLPTRKDGESDDAFAKRWAWIGDGEVPGFGVKIYGSGRKVYAVRYRTTTGRQRMVSLGQHGELTVKRAREKAAAEKVRILDGEDPQAEKEKAREAADFATVKELMTGWVEEYAQQHRRRHKEDKYRSDRHIIPALGRVHLSDLTVARLSRWHRELGADTPVEANRCLETLRAAFRWGHNEKRLPGTAPSPAIFNGGRKAPVKRFKERSRTRWLRKDEVKRLMEATGKEMDTYARAAVPLLLLTGLRKRELLRAEWRRVDLDRGEIHLTETKSGEEQERALPPAAVEILRELPREDGSPYVFPSPKDKMKPRDDIKGPWKRIREAANLEDVTLHDLRRTAGSLMAQAGVPLEAIGEVLGHARNKAVTKVYARMSGDVRRDALGTLSDALSGALGLSKDPKGQEPQDLPTQLVALVEATKDDPEAFREGLRALGLGEAAEA